MFLFSRISFLILFFILLTGCESTSIPKEIRQTIKIAGKNGKELKKVIRHYQKLNDTTKLKAVYFIIGNMHNKYGIENHQMYSEYSLLEDVNLQKNSNKLSREALDDLLKEQLDSFRQLNGTLNISNSNILPDVETISASYLIKNIELSFELWKKPWARHIAFHDFCEYILPYRIHNEAMSNWREVFHNKLKYFEDSLENPKDPKELVTLLSNYLYRKWNHLPDFSINGVYPDLVSMAKFNGGQCDHRYFLFTAMCRSMGLAVGIDRTPQWTTAPNGHSWNFIIDSDGRKRPFNGAEDNMRFYEKNLIPMEDGGYVCTKVYRQTFSNQMYALPKVKQTKDKSTIPAFFQTENIVDVTNEYDMPKAGCKIAVESKHKDKTVYLFTYTLGNELNSVAWGQVVNDSVDFGYIGVPAFYVPAIYNDRDEIEPVSDALLWPVQKEYRQLYNPDLSKRGTSNIYRKYYASGAFMEFAREMVGGTIQGSNKQDFSSAVNLAVIKKQPDAYHELIISNAQKFRYIRYLPNKNSPIHIAEMEVWGLDDNGNDIKLSGSPFGHIHKQESMKSTFQFAFDNNIRTNFNAENDSWIGMDFHKGIRFTRVWMLPRNNYNVIELGHNYELFYLDNYLKWKSLGSRIAKKHYLDYNNIPCEAMLLLKNYTSGKEERLFLYDCEKHLQYWF